MAGERLKTFSRDVRSAVLEKSTRTPRDSVRPRYGSR